MIKIPNQTFDMRPMWSLVIGDYRIGPASDPERITIENDNGESGEFSGKEFYEVIDKFFKEAF